VGCHDGSCVVSDSLIENNWIHDTRGSQQGDGIEIKKGSHSNIIRDNVIHDTYYPCLILYGTAGNPPNIVERNVMWNCDDAAIQVAADAVVRNNILIPGTGQGVSSQSSNGVDPSNLQFINNTIIGGSTCLRLNGWGGQPGMVFANNAVYCPNDSFVIGSLSGVTVSGNVFAPAISAMPASGYTIGRSLEEDFVDTGARNFYPTANAPLLGAATSGLQPADDFNGVARLAPGDVGAYEWDGATNPGWAVVAGLKNIAPPGTDPAPRVTLQANPVSLAYEGSATLTWTSTDATSCTASGGWAGNKPLAGSESTGALRSGSSFTLTCANSAGQSAVATVSVAVAEAPPSAPAPEARRGGGGAVGIWSLVFFGGALLRRSRR
jgi:hypothetical protein